MKDSQLMSLRPSNNGEYDAVALMLRRAAKYGLETEVVLALCRELSGDESPGLRDAIWTALKEWDL